jgi:Protein of unknown function
MNNWPNEKASASDIDRMLLSFCEKRWLKVARIIGKTMEVLERRGVEMDGGVADQMDARMAALVGSGQLEAAGNIKKWRYSEVRLPSESVEAAE